MLVSKEASFRSRPLRCSKGVPLGQIRQNHGCNTFALLRSLIPTLQQKFANAFSDPQPTIVLHDFARSFSADIRGILMEYGLLIKSRSKAGKGVNDGLAFRDVPEKR